MKKRLKGLISWWLVFAMLFSSVTVSFAAETTAEVQSTDASYYIGSDSLFSGASVGYRETTDLKLYYGEGASKLTEQVSSLEEANRPENKILLGWKLWGMHYYGELHSGPREKTLTDVVTAEDIEICFEGDGYDDGDNYYNPLVEPHYVDKYIIDPQPTNETFTVGGKEYKKIDDGAYYETTDVTYQWHLWETVPYTVVNTVEDETNEIAKSYTWKLTFSEGKWLTTANNSYSEIDVAAQTGDTIDIKFDSDFSGSVRAYYSSGDYEYNSETQSYQYSVTEDGNAYVYIWPNDTSIQHTFTMSVLRSSVGESIVGETDVTLTDKSEGNEYVCKLTFAPDEDNVILISNPVAYTAPPHIHPICGAAHTDIGNHTGTCENVDWTAWNGTSDFPGGNVYLPNDITLEETLEISSGTVNLCLNGNDILSDNTAIKVTEGAILNICDCSSDKTGTIKSGYYGIYNVGGAVNIYGGKVSGTSVSTVYISGGTLNLRGGRLESISAENNATALYITSSASVEISGGEIYAEGGSDGAVCGVLINDSTSSTTISGGTISAGCTNTASSSRYYTVAAVKHLSGNLSVIGGTLTTDTADNCSAGYVAALYDNRQSNDETSTITISGGTFELKKSKGSQIIGAVITDWSEMPINLSGDLVITAESAPDFAIDPSTPLSFTSKGLNEPEEPYTVAKQNRSSADYPWKFTTGWSQTGISATDIGKYFVAYGDNYRVTKADNGELQLSETYTISFDAYPATSPDSQKLLYGEKVTEPTTPVREGYGLNHWCTDSSSCTNGTTCENAWDFDTDTVTKGDTLYAVWESTHWRVTLRAQGGECDDAYSYADKITGKLESLPTATRVGYTFNGWFDASEGGNKITTETKFTGDTRIYAQWTAYEITQQPTVDNEYEVKVNPSANVAYTWHEMTETAVTTENADVFNAKDSSSSYNPETGEWTSPSAPAGDYNDAYYYFTNLDLASGDIIRLTFSDEENQVFLSTGGNRSDDIYEYCAGTEVDVQIDADDTYSLCVANTAGTNTKTVKAKIIRIGEAISGQTTNKLTDGTDGTKYVAKITYPDGTVLTSEAVEYIVPTYTVTLNTNGGTIDSGNITSYIAGEETALPTDISKEGHSFAGWYEDENFTGSAVTTIGSTEKGDKEYFAKWTANSYKFTTIVDGEKTEVTYEYGAAITAPAEPTKTGYTFAGWDEDIPATMPANDVTVTAQWMVNKHDIIYMVDGVEYRRVEDVAYGTAITLIDAPTQTGYTFSGWSTAPATMLDSDVTITGTFTVNKYNVIYKVDDVQVGETETYDYGASVTIREPYTKEGYTVSAWSIAEGFAMPAENVEINATSTVNQYTITFNTDGGSTVGAITQDYNTAVTAPAAPTKTGYTFAGWDKDIPTTMPAEDITITAKWTANQYTITFNTDGGTAVNAITQDYNTAVTAPAAPTKTGYIFAGWDKGIPATMPAENVTITATWTANSYKVVFDANGGEGEMADQSFTYDEAQPLTSNAFTRSGYSFAGWAAAENGVAVYVDGQNVRDLTAEDDAVINLYAVWSAMPVYGISGTVFESDTTTPISGAAVQLKQGSTVLAEVTTDASGNYSIPGVSAGLYNVVAGKDGVTMTIMVEVTGNLTGQNITMPARNTNSVLNVTNDEGAAEFKVVVDGLDQEAAHWGDENHSAASVTITMTVTAEAEDQNDTEQEEIRDKAPGATVEFLDITVTKTVDSDSSSLTETNQVLEIVVPYDFSGKINVNVYRKHGAEPAAALIKLSTEPTAPYTDGSFWPDTANGKIHIYTNKFSTYAIGYTVPTSSSGGYTPTYAITLEKSENGEVKANRSYASSGSTVTITVDPEDGYVLDELTVTDSQGNEIEVTDKGDGTFTFKMPSRKVTVTAVFAPDGGYSTCPKDNTCPIWPYTDAETTAWYHDGVHYCIENGLMAGYGNGIFKPNADTTRAMITVMLWRLNGSPVVNYLLDFEDVEDGKWYTEAIRWAKSEGIAEGYGNGFFGTNDAITREQMVTILWRYAQYKGIDVSVGEDTNILSYNDAFDVAEYAIPAMQWACGSGMVQGMNDPDGEGMILAPESKGTRAQIATMMMRFCTEIAQK